MLHLAGLVSFLHGSWYWAVPWICPGSSVDNTGMPQLLLNCGNVQEIGRRHSQDC